MKRVYSVALVISVVLAIALVYEASYSGMVTACPEIPCSSGKTAIALSVGSPKECVCAYATNVRGKAVYTYDNKDIVTIRR